MLSNVPVQRLSSLFSLNVSTGAHLACHRVCRNFHFVFVASRQRIRQTSLKEMTCPVLSLE